MLVARSGRVHSSPLCMSNFSILVNMKFKHIDSNIFLVFRDGSPLLRSVCWSFSPAWTLVVLTGPSLWISLMQSCTGPTMS
jgi:hypothetical protein